MTTVNYTDLYASAIKEAGAGSEVLPDGDDYEVRIASVKGGASKSGAKPQIGVRLEVISGPHAGKSTWVNQTFTADNPKAVAVFLRIMKSLGVPDEAIAAGVPPEKLGDYIAVNTKGIAALGHHVYNDRSYQDIKKFTITGIHDAASAVAAPAAVVPPVPVPPVPVAAPAPVAAPEPPAVPAVPAPAPAAVPAPVAPPAPGGTPPF